MPAIQQQLGLSQQEVGLFTAVYMLPGVLLAIPLGVLVDVVGRRKVFSIMGLIFGLAGGAQGLTEGFSTILTLRAIQGAGFAALMPLSVTLIGDAYQGIAQVRAQAVRQVSLAGADFVLPVLGASLATVAWNYPLFLQASVLPLAFVGAFVLDDDLGETGPRNAYARRIRSSLLRAGMRPLMIAGFARFFLKFALVTYLPLLLVHQRGLSITQVGLVLGVGSGVAAVTATQVARLLRHGAGSRWMVASMVALACAMGAFANAPGFGWALSVALVYGVGDGTFAVLQSGYLTQAVPTEVRAGVVAVSGMIRNAGKFAGPLLTAVIISFVSLPTAFMLLAAAALVLIPVMAMLRSLDVVLRAAPTGP